MKLSSSEKTRLKTKYGPWAIVTGASSGIGKEIAERLAEAGLNLVLNARNESVLSTFANELRGKYSIDTKIIAADASIETEKIINACEGINIGLLVVSAGFGTSGLFVNADIKEEINMLKVNYEALLKITHHFCQYFKSKGKGGIILMSSMVGFQGTPHAAHYAATKAYVQSLAEALYEEMKPFGVDVLAAASGPVASGFGGRADMKMNMTLTPQQVGIPILEALGRKSTVLPGFLTKFLVGSLRTVPRWGKVKIMNIVMGGMTAHQEK
jgi:uncharacterized protein